MSKTHIAFTLQQMLRERAAMLCYKCLAYLVMITSGTTIRRQIHKIFIEFRKTVVWGCDYKRRVCNNYYGEGYDILEGSITTFA